MAAELSNRYQQRRGQIETYFDCTALDNWAQLTTDDKVSRIRQTVREGRESMRATLVGWLPDALDDRRVFDAGCGTGATAEVLAQRGAQVVGVDLSENLVNSARERTAGLQLVTGAGQPSAGSLMFSAGDMLDPAFGTFDHVVAMDSLIHYGIDDIAHALDHLKARTSRSILFTVAPATPLLKIMHRVGQWMPRQNRSPDLVPVDVAALAARLADAEWSVTDQQRISRGFYTSQALRLERR